MMRVLLCVLVAGSLFGCGVKGRPLPPEEPPYIGDGQPDRVEDLEDPNMPPLTGDEEDVEEDDDEEEID